MGLLPHSRGDKMCAKTIRGAIRWHITTELHADYLLLLTELWITMLNGSVPVTLLDNCPLPALLPCHQLYGSAASGMTGFLP
jgi:hypothetical protein